MQAGIGALSLRRARHCCASLSLSCRRQGWCAVAGAGVSGKVERDILGITMNYHAKAVQLSASAVSTGALAATSLSSS